MHSKAADAESTNLEPFIRELPYEPSVPCAGCARGVDPLRAARVSATDDGLAFFCSEVCRERYRAAERRAAASDVVRPISRPLSSRVPTDSIARRVEPTAPATPHWPLIATACAVAIAYLPLSGAAPIAALLLAGIAATFASRATLAREHGGLVSWLAPPLGIGLLGLSTLLVDRSPLLAAALGLLLMWAREQRIDRDESSRLAAREELAARIAPTARIQAGELEPIDRPVAQLRHGDIFLAEVGETLPADAIVVAGHGSVTPYPAARERLARSAHDAVLAGAAVAEGSLKLRTLRVGRERLLFKALASVREVRGFGGGMEFAARARELQVETVPLLFAVALAALTQRGVALVASCAAALLTLPALASARASVQLLRAARVAASARGLFFRDASVLARAARIASVAIRVEGVLVPRAYTVVGCSALSPNYDARQLLELALSAELAAEEHALARAIRAYAEPLGIRPEPLRRIAYVKGQGISALTDGEGALVVGNRQALLAAGVSVAVADREAQIAERAGRRVVFVAVGGHVRGLMVFEQNVRPEARVAVQQLFDLGLEVELVAGDHRATVEAIAQPLDVTHVKAELNAAQRAAEVERLRQNDAKVAAIGFLHHDEAMLAAADLPLYLDAAGLAEQPDLICVSRDLRDAAAAFAIARATRRRARFLLAGLLVGLALTFVAAAGLLHPALSVLAALALEFALSEGSRLSLSTAPRIE